MDKMTNFLSEDDFERFLHSLCQMLETRHADPAKPGMKLSMPIEGFEELFKLAYGSALRISEALNLTKDALDFDKRIITLTQTKTGFKRCKCSKWEKSRMISCNKDCPKCQGYGKVRKAQYTTIHPKYLDSLAKYVKSSNGSLFNTNRFTLWSYAKQAGELAGLNVFEQQDERLIEGVWTHLFRKSRAQQMMRDKGPDELGDFVYELVKIKLRHSAKAKDVTQRYSNIIGQKLGLNDLLEWEQKHYG